MTETERIVPELRFKGFIDDWEQRKLGDTFEFSVSTNSLSRAQLNYEKGNIKSIHYGDILIKYNSILEITKDKIPFITDGSIEKYKPNLLENGDVVFADAAEDETVGKAVEINGISDEYVVAGLHTIVARPKEKMAKYFSGYYINADVYQRQLLRLMQGTKVSSISKGNLKKTIVAYPKNLAEQQKIGSFFKQLDNAIALHQRKLTLLKQLKQTYLKQIFPQNKENMPALRFAGFSEPWKQSKFDEVFSHVQNNSLSRADLNYKSGYAMNIHYGDILIRFGEYLDVSKYQLPMIANKQLVEKYKSSILKDGDIVIADAAEDETVGKCSELGGIEDANILAGLHTIPSRPNWTFASGYLGYYMNSSAFHDQLLPLIQGTKISSISKSALKKTDIKYPHGKDEQTKIGNLFKQLDDSIALHQSKLEKLMDLKQVLLVKMFV